MFLVVLLSTPAKCDGCCIFWAPHTHSISITYCMSSGQRQRPEKKTLGGCYERDLSHAPFESLSQAKGVFQ